VMMKTSLALVAFAVLMASAQAHPRRHSSEESSEESMDMSDWMDEMMEKKEKHDEKKEHFEMFMKMMKFMKEMKEKKEKMEESKEFHDLFKAFAKMVWKKESMGSGSMSMSEESSEEKSEESSEEKSGDKDMMKMFMEEKDGSSESRSSEEGEKEEHMKKMFVLFMQFKSHMMKQKKMEEMKEKKEEKAMKQMKAFKALIAFAHKAEEKKEMMHKMMEMVEKKMKAKFMMFKKCAFEGKCMKGSESDESSEESHEGSESSEEMDGEMKMLKEMMEGKMSGESSGESQEEEDKDEHRMMLFMAMKKMMEHGGEGEEAMEAMKEHLSKHGDKEMWGNDDEDEEMKKMKKMFMMAKSMKMMKAMKEHKEEESAKMFKFMIFMKHMEEAKMMERSFAEFMGWKQDQMMMRRQNNIPHLTYFDIRGRGEITRLMFAAGKKEYTETRVPITGDDWTLLKPTMPYQQLPILNISGQVYGQSLAIQAYIAKETGFYPEHKRQQMRVDEIALAREDLFIAESNAFGVVQQDPTQRAQLTANLIATAYPLYFGRFAQIIRENEARSGFAVGDKPTMADFVIFEGTTSVMQSNPQVLDAFPELKALRVKMAGWPGVAEYLATRPFSEI